MTIRRNILRLLDILALATMIGALVMTLAGCALPVRAVPSDKPILVAPVGTQHPQEDGSTALNPGLPQPKAEDYKPAAGVGWAGWANGLLTVAGLVLGGTGVGAWALPLIGKAKTAIRIASELADQCAAAETDKDVEIAKSLAAAKQEALGVRTLTNKARRKTTNV